MLNALLVLCIVVEMILGVTMLQTREKYERLDIARYSSSDLFGNEDLMKKINTSAIAILDYTIASQCQTKEVAKEKEDNMKSVATNLQYIVSKTTKDGKKIEIANCNQNLDNITNVPIFALYQGNLNGKEYIKKWTNYYSDAYTKKYEMDATSSYDSTDMDDVDEDADGYDFSWLSINTILQDLCKNNPVYAKFVAKNIVENLSTYKKNIKESLCSRYEYNVADEAMLKTILPKLYEKNCLNELESASARQFMKKMVDRDKNGLQLEDLEYNEESGLVYNSYRDTYYDIESGYSFKGENEKEYKKYVDLKTKENEKNNALNGHSLTKEEKSFLLTTITEILCKESQNDVYSGVDIPIGTVLNTPEKYNIYIGIDQSIYTRTQGKYMIKYDKLKQQGDGVLKTLENECIAIVAVAIVFVVILFLLFYVCGRKVGTEEIQFLAIDKWYTEIEMIVMCIFMVTGFLLLFSSLASIVEDLTGIKAHLETIWGGLFFIALCLVLCVQFLCSFVRKAKGGILFKQSIIGKITSVVKKQVANSKIKKTSIFLYILVCGGWLFAEFIGFATESLTWLAFMQIILVAIMVAFGLWLCRHFGKLENIRDGVKRVKEGEIKYQIPIDDKDDVLNNMAKDINSLSEGLEKSVNEMVKSERLKTELISNVSHDIKTPLTSIITYVDLIKKEDVKPDKVKEYISVLDQKSQRLKALTDDLFEAAKATSGAMSMDISKIDLGSLVNQALGEYSEKLEKVDLDIRNNIGEKEFFVYADGRLAWRILENLLGNIAKYALPGSRVYVDASNDKDFVELIIKNISCVELNISANELMERFTRGDQSRNTEGSGLGLNIAQSLVKLQSGKFYVEIDGDLFKAILRLPKAAE